MQGTNGSSQASAGAWTNPAFVYSTSRPAPGTGTRSRVFQEAIEEAPAQPDPDAMKNPAAVALGKLGGVKGGKARAAKMTPEERRESARKAAWVRWGKE